MASQEQSIYEDEIAHDDAAEQDAAQARAQGEDAQTQEVKEEEVLPTRSRVLLHMGLLPWQAVSGKLAAEATTNALKKSAIGEKVERAASLRGGQEKVPTGLIEAEIAEEVWLDPSLSSALDGFHEFSLGVANAPFTIEVPAVNLAPMLMEFQRWSPGCITAIEPNLALMDESKSGMVALGSARGPEDLTHDYAAFRAVEENKAFKSKYVQFRKIAGPDGSNSEVRAEFRPLGGSTKAPGVLKPNAYTKSHTVFMGGFESVDVDDMTSASYRTFVKAIGAEEIVDIKPLRSCGFKYFAVEAKYNLRSFDQVMAKLEKRYADTNTGVRARPKGTTFELSFYAREAGAKAAFKLEDDRKGGKGGKGGVEVDQVLGVVQEMFAGLKAELSEQNEKAMDMQAKQAEAATRTEESVRTAGEAVQAMASSIDKNAELAREHMQEQRKINAQAAQQQALLIQLITGKRLGGGNVASQGSSTAEIVEIMEDDDGDATKDGLKTGPESGVKGGAESGTEKGATSSDGGSAMDDTPAGTSVTNKRPLGQTSGNALPLFDMPPPPGKNGKAPKAIGKSPVPATNASAE